MVNTEKQIIDEYFVFSADIKPQATISIYKEEFDAYIGITPQGIKEYAVLNKKYIVGKNSENDFFVIKKGEEKYKQLKHEEFKLFIESINTVFDKIKWKDV